MANIDDIKQLDRNKPYEDFRKEFVTDPVTILENASKVEMSLAQYANFTSPETLLTEKRSITARLTQDEGLFTRNSNMSKASLVSEYLESPHRIALLQDTLYKSYYGERTAITFETDSAVGSPLLPFANSQPAPIAAGLRLNPGELIANSHEVGTDNYRPFRWDYDKSNDDKNLKRHQVNPGAVIPATTLGSVSGIVQMKKWGNRFVLPYEVLTGNDMRINKLASMIRIEGLTEEGRMYEELIEVFEDGDGTTGSAADTQDITDYGGTANTFGFVPFLNWLDESMEYPFQITHVIMRQAQMRALRTALSALTGNLALEQLNSVGLAPGMANMESRVGTVRYGRAPDSALSENHVLGIDARAAMEYVSRSGMAIRQQADNIASESREVVISDTYLWAKLAHEATKVLDISQ